VSAGPGSAGGGQASRPPARLSGRSVLVAGAGVSGESAARTLLAAGAEVTLTAPRAEQARTAALAELGVRVLFDLAGPPPGTDLVVTSPGWRPDQPLLKAAEAAGVEVIGEVELAWRLQPGDGPAWLALTGTNGKTTTVRMLESVLLAAGRRAVAAGNVGLPITRAALARPPYQVLAVELSSFQLYRSPTLRPLAAAVLNLAEDHLDWHGTMADYAAAKARIWAGGVAVGNADDPAVRDLLAAAPGRHVTFTLGAPLPGQLGVVGGTLVDRAFADPDGRSGGDPDGGPDRDPAFAGPDGGDPDRDPDGGDPDGGGPDGPGVVLGAVSDVRPAGPHNVANALAAAALARAYGVPAAAVGEGLRRFVPDRHRNEPVAEVAGVAYVDDSKATNPHAAAASLAGYPRVVWVAGGQLKGADVDALVAAHAHRLAGAVLLGQDRAAIAAAIARHAPDLPVVEIASSHDGAMLEVVRAAAGLAGPGDTVLLAPAGASWDMFANYGARGDAFAAAVRALARPA
jgi:UDP-N-acetylmuramoylalanine--D-glutamate ligase